MRLLKSLRLPVILYSVEVLQQRKSIAALDNVIDRAVFRNFGCGSIANAVSISADLFIFILDCMILPPPVLAEAMFSRRLFVRL